MPVLVLGVDATKHGWVGVELADGTFVRTHLLTVETRFDDFGDFEIIAVDIPIGFGPREADRAARRLLKGASSTVFTTPSRDLLEVPFRAGLGVSAQAHALGPRILHVTDLARTDKRLREVHPEVSFRAMNGGVGLRFRKKSAGGVRERKELLRRHGIELTEYGDAAIAPIDDLLDAAAAAWSAHRVATGRARSLPETPEVIEGRQVAIWC